MKYILCKTFKQKGISKEFNLRKGTNCESINGFITYKGDTICSVSSQNAYDFFSYNEDNNGAKRYELTSAIKEKIKEYVREYNDAHAELISSFTEDTTEETKKEEMANLVDKSVLAYDILFNKGMGNNYLLHTATIELLEEALEEINAL